MLFPNIKFVGFFHDVFLSATFSLILFEKNNIIFSSTSVLRKLYNKPDNPSRKYKVKPLHSEKTLKSHIGKVGIKFLLKHFFNLGLVFTKEAILLNNRL